MTTHESQLTMRLLDNVPRKNWQKLFFKMPLYIWRLGLEFLLPPSFACITTRGRKSGLPRHTMVEYTQIGDKYYIASGWQDKPHWVQNLLADPIITIEPSHGELTWGTVRQVNDDETLLSVFIGMQDSPMLEPWLASMGIEPIIKDVIENKDKLTIFEVTPTDNEIVLPPLQQNRRWMLWILAAVVILLGRVRFNNHKNISN